MDIAVGDKPSCVARLDRSEPKRDVGGLRWQDIGHVGALHVLVVQGGGIENRKRALAIWAVDVDREMNPLPHADPKVALLNHPEHSRSSGGRTFGECYALQRVRIVISRCEWDRGRRPRGRARFRAAMHRGTSTREDCHFPL